MPTLKYSVFRDRGYPLAEQSADKNSRHNADGVQYPRVAGPVVLGFEVDDCSHAGVQ